MAREADDNGTPKMKRKVYEKELARLQEDLCMLQEWVKYKGLRVIIVFEGRDAAGKGGTIKAITERVSPRVFRVVALPAPSDREKSQMYVHIEDPLRQWKLSSTDLESRRRWYDYSRARDRMLDITDTGHAPWYIVRSDDKRRARLNCIAHLLSLIPYDKVPRSKGVVPARATEHAYDDEASLRGRRFVPEKY